NSRSIDISCLSISANLIHKAFLCSAIFFPPIKQADKSFIPPAHLSDCSTFSTLTREINISMKMSGAVNPLFVL
ncbi:hypothetical protein MOC33_22985, partial [Bacillus spizizenii]|nr:hypothetical protein [Bacillus spizizenii]